MQHLTYLEIPKDYRDRQTSLRDLCYTFWNPLTLHWPGFKAFSTITNIYCVCIETSNTFTALMCNVLYNSLNWYASLSYPDMKYSWKADLSLCIWISSVRMNKLLRFLLKIWLRAILFVPVVLKEISYCYSMKSMCMACVMFSLISVYSSLVTKDLIALWTCFFTSFQI